jgi:hypothetical protein|tara:strand:+ start:4080 stop:4952 length:873 start_codon:yes stop_codon:yes gene_type:complete
MRYIISDSGVVNAIGSGKAYTFDKNHPNYEALVRHAKSGNVEHFEASYDVASSVEHFCDGYIHIQNGTLNWDGIPMPELFTERILNMKKEGFSFEPMLNFLDNINENPSDDSVVELFDFMQHKHLPITDDGHFLAYKAVNGDFKDIWSGSIDNSVGSTVNVDRGSVDSNRNKHCSAGLHVGAIDYVTQYGGINIDNMDDSDGGNQIVICKVNPRDVVSVPSDSKFQKLRCCQYEVVAIFNDVFKSSVELMGQKIDGLKVARYDEAWKENVRVRLDTLVSSLRKRTQTAGA